MHAIGPHYLLLAAATHCGRQPGRWRFVLEPLSTGQRFTATDVEPAIDGDRLELLAVVRGLEALDGPSQVTLLTRSRYVRRGIRFELNQWRDADWRWESFGKLVPIRDRDLWQRVDRALAFHHVECLRWQWGDVARELDHADAPQLVAAAPEPAEAATSPEPRVVVRRRSHRPARPAQQARRRVAAWGHDAWAAFAGLGQPALSRTA